MVSVTAVQATPEPYSMALSSVALSIAGVTKGRAASCTATYSQSSGRALRPLSTLCCRVAPPSASFTHSSPFMSALTRSLSPALTTTTTPAYSPLFISVSSVSLSMGLPMSGMSALL